MTLTEFLLARIAEDEEIAHEATNDGHKWLVEEETISLWPDDLEPATGNIHFPRKAHAYHAVTWNPARVLAECDAKRRIIADFETLDADYRITHDPQTEARRFQALVSVGQLATAYAGHPDYDPQWRP